MNKLWTKIFSLRILKRIYLERMGEPIIYNIVSIFILFFGNFTKKIDYDLIPRQPYAFGLNEAFKGALRVGANEIIIIEFGVASGAGLFNLAHIASKLSKIYGVDYQIVGFDTGKGMPDAIDYRDHPEKYRKGDFPSLKLQEAILPKNTRIIYGEINETVSSFLNSAEPKTKIAFVSIDVDYYSSTKDCLKLFEINSNFFLPSTILYLDDVNNIDHNAYCGELLAINEFNEENKIRKIAKMTQLRNWRIFKNALWIDQMYFLHILDSDFRDPKNWMNEEPVILNNPYL